MGKQQKLEQVAYLYIKDQIIQRNWQLGHHIIEANISDELEMSRSPIRAALATLAEEEAVEVKPYRGYFVQDDLHEQDGAGFYLVYFIVIWYRLTDRLKKNRSSMKKDLNTLDDLMKEVRQALDQEDWETFHERVKDLFEVYFAKTKQEFLVEQLLRCYTIVTNAVIDTKPGRAQQDYLTYEALYLSDITYLFKENRFIDTRTLMEMFARFMQKRLPAGEQSEGAIYTPYITN
ncbi:MAG: GntR family transcriptional regulator [Aerococcus sp.]|nr:GntR family transcriptional regulator [Aerococcus sp.]